MNTIDYVRALERKITDLEIGIADALGQRDMLRVVEARARAVVETAEGDRVNRDMLASLEFAIRRLEGARE